MHISIGCFCSLIIFWIGLTGFPNDYKSMVFALSASIISYFIGTRLNLFPKQNSFKFVKTAQYILWLLKEIITSSIAISKLAWKRNIIILPVIEPIKTIQTTELGSVILANSITLTPGTVTLSLEKNNLLVHAIDIKFMDDLKKGEMDNKIKEIIKQDS